VEKNDQLPVSFGHLQLNNPGYFSAHHARKS
jgi:hypothetical protein